MHAPQNKRTGTQMGVISIMPVPFPPTPGNCEALTLHPHFLCGPQAPSAFTLVSLPPGRSPTPSLLPGPVWMLPPREPWGPSHGLPSPPSVCTWPDWDHPCCEDLSASLLLGGAGKLGLQILSQHRVSLALCHAHSRCSLTTSWIQLTGLPELSVCQ